MNKDGLILYHHNSSVCAAKIRVALAEKALDFESRLLRLDGDQFHPEYLALNPYAVVPTLVQLRAFRVEPATAVADTSVVMEKSSDHCEWTGGISRARADRIKTDSERRHLIAYARGPEPRLVDEGLAEDGPAPVEALPVVREPPRRHAGIGRQAWRPAGSGTRNGRRSRQGPRSRSRPTAISGCSGMQGKPREVVMEV